MSFLLRWFVTLALLVLIAMLGGCGALRKQGYVGAGAAAGAAGGAALGGPLGAAVGAAAGAIAVGATAESDELRSGDIVGEEALVRELDRWKSRAMSSASEAALWRTQAQAEAVAKDVKTDWLKWGAALASAWFAWRNRTHIAAAFKGGGLRQLWHAVWGGHQPIIGLPASDWAPPEAPAPFVERAQAEIRKLKGKR